MEGKCNENAYMLYKKPYGLGEAKVAKLTGPGYARPQGAIVSHTQSRQIDSW